MIYLCCDENRRNAVLEHATLNGIHYLEVLDKQSPVEALRQQTLLLRFLKSVSELDEQNILIEGGERITPIKVLWAAPATNLPADRLAPEEQAFFDELHDKDALFLIRTDSSGDFSTYTLRLVSAESDLTPPVQIDPLLAQVDFSFKVECPSEFDCQPQRVCPEVPRTEPDINYLAKDYGSFRRLLLDRMAQLVPNWRERSPADLGIVLVELLAHVADQLSYQQDAVATEAYLGTARSRVSVRRHARLVDYPMHDGANARAWVHIEAAASGVELPKGTRLLTKVSGPGARIASVDSREYEAAMRQRPVVFESMHPVTLHQAHNRIRFYTWGEHRCCLPRGATRATLVGHLSDLHSGDVLVFEEVLGPDKGRTEDADPSKRHLVRLVEVQHSRPAEVQGGVEEAAEPLDDPLTGQVITEIRWHDEDRLPVTFCLSVRTEADALVEDVSVARGNMVLADHGLTIEGEPLGTVPKPHLHLVPEASADRCERQERIPVPPRFRPRLQEGPLTQAAPDPYPELNPQPGIEVQDDDSSIASARSAMYWHPDSVKPEITLNGEGSDWVVKPDFMASGPDDLHFVAEIENDGIAYLRFATSGQCREGGRTNGKRPRVGSTFHATYRIGNGAAGNIGAEALAHIVTDDASVVAVRNPLPAQGGTDPESLEQVRKRAPWAFRIQARAVTPADYEQVSTRHPKVQRAAATFRWTGSWHTAFVTVDRFGGLPVDSKFEQEIRAHLEPFRMAGYDLEVDAPRFVPLELDLQACVKADYFRSDVKAALLDELSNRDLPNGQRGLFHPDDLTFGQKLHASDIYAAAQAVPGVDSVRITRFQRMRQRTPRFGFFIFEKSKPLVQPTLAMDRLEIARLDNDPNFPERGIVRLDMQGGK